MKEATSELAGSVIVFTAVAALAAFFFLFIWPNYIRPSFIKTSDCANAVCDSGYNSNGNSWCYTPCKKGTKSTKCNVLFECPYRG